MKKTISLLIAFVMLLSLTTGFNLTAYADSSYVTYGNLTYEIQGDHIVIMFTDASATTIEIPSTINGIPVTIIGECAFGGSSLKNITIPNSVTSINGLAFEHCENLTSIDIDTDNLYYSSEDGVLFDKSKSELLKYPEGKKDSEYEIPNSVTSIAGAFSNCIYLKSLKIPNSVTDASDLAMYSLSLTSIDVNTDNLYYSSEDGVLFDKSKSVLLRYPEGKKDSEYEIPNSVTTIGERAFCECKSLTNISIPNSVTSIGDSAFEYCENLTNISIPNSITNIGSSAFEYCENLTSIDIDTDNLYYSSEDGVLFDKSKSVLLKYPEGKTDSEYEIPNTVTDINGGAFWGCINLKNLKIPNSVTDINGFSCCTSLESIIIPDSVTSIGDFSFYSCLNLTNIIIPNSVTSIGDCAFSNCFSLTNIIIPNSVTTIGESAFCECKSLTSITIQNSVTSIGDGAFDYCENLSDVYYNGSQEEWNTLLKDHVGDYSWNGLSKANIHCNSTSGTDSIPTGGGGGFIPAPTPDDTTKKDEEQKPDTNPTQPTTSSNTTEKPATVKINKAQTKKKALAVFWNKLSNVSGYQIQVATDKKFKKNKKTVTVAKQNASKKTVKKLKAKKKYYVRVRSYKIVNGKKVFGKWSKIKAIKTK